MFATLPQWAWAASPKSFLPIVSTGGLGAYSPPLVPSPLATIFAHPFAPMSSKRQKMTATQASEEPARTYDHDRFVNESVVKKFGLISKTNLLLRKRGFTTPRTSSAKLLRIRDGGRYVNRLTPLPRVWYENFTPISPPTF